MTTTTGWLPSGQSAPAGTLTLPRQLHDGAGYTLTAAVPGVTTLAIRDADGDTALASLDRADVRRLIEDLELVAGLRPTPAKVDLAVRLAASMRILLQRIDDDLEKIDQVAADEIRAAMVAHLRAKRPLLLARGAL